MNRGFFVLVGILLFALEAWTIPCESVEVSRVSAVQAVVAPKLPLEKAWFPDGTFPVITEFKPLRNNQGVLMTSHRLSTTNAKGETIELNTEQAVRARLRTNRDPIYDQKEEILWDWKTGSVSKLANPPVGLPLDPKGLGDLLTPKISSSAQQYFFISLDSKDPRGELVIVKDSAGQVYWRGKGVVFFDPTTQVSVIWSLNDQTYRHYEFFEFVIFDHKAYEMRKISWHADMSTLIQKGQMPSFAGEGSPDQSPPYWYWGSVLYNNKFHILRQGPPVAWVESDQIEDGPWRYNSAGRLAVQNFWTRGGRLAGSEDGKHIALRMIDKSSLVLINTKNNVAHYVRTADRIRQELATLGTDAVFPPMDKIPVTFFAFRDPQTGELKLIDQMGRIRPLR